jgi:Tfp pilus assembly protein PilX
MNTGNLGGNRRLRGGVLITALIFTAIISLFALGVAVVASSHISRASVEADYATAIQLADAGINFELRWLSEDTTTAGARAHQIDSPYRGTVNGITGQGSFTVSVMNLDGTGPWAPPNGLKIRSTGTINGISRTVEITGANRGIFGEYAVFMIGDDAGMYPNFSREIGKLGGSGSTVNGNLGTNGGIDWTSGDSTKVNGEVTFNGYTPTQNESGPNAWYNDEHIQWPTVSQVAELYGGLEHLKSNNNNANVKTFLATDTESLIANAIVKAGGVDTGVLGNTGQYRSYDGFEESQNIQDKAPDGTRYVNRWLKPNGQYDAEGIYGSKVIIFPPGDYYFTGLSNTNGMGSAIIIDNAAGPVRWWINGGSADDSLDLPVFFTSTDKSKFRLYYNNCNSLSIGGNSAFYGSIYAHNDACGSPVLPAVKVAGNSVVNGSVIGNYIWLAGNSIVNFPNNGAGEADGDYTLWFGFRNTYREVNTNGGTVFPDGTDR